MRTEKSCRRDDTRTADEENRKHIGVQFIRMTALSNWFGRGAYSMPTGRG